MKVLHLGAGNLYGGVETFLLTLARLRHLAPEMEPEFALCFRARLWDQLATIDVPLFDLGEVRVSRPWTVVRARRRLSRVLVERKPDTVVVHSSWVHLVFGPVVRAVGVRLVFFAHNPLNTSTWLDRWASRTRPDLVIANSRFTAGSVQTMFPGVPTEVAYLPVEVALPVDRIGTKAAVRSELATPESVVVILMACRLERLKGHAVLLEALGRLKDQPGWISWIAGGVQRQPEKTYLEELKALCEQLGIANRVKFLGQRADVPRLLVSADLFCQPNTRPESFGLAFVEALAAGLPVITSAIGGALEIINETCGVLVPPDDPVRLAVELGSLIVCVEHLRCLSEHGPERARGLGDPKVRLTRLAELLARRE